MDLVRLRHPGYLRRSGRDGLSPFDQPSGWDHDRAALPEEQEAVLFRPDLSLAACCENVYEEWCPNSNLFEGEAAARSWSEGRQLEGQILSLTEASELAAGEWQPLVQGLSLDQ